MRNVTIFVTLPALLVAGAVIATALPAAAASRLVAVPSFTRVAVESSLTAIIAVGGPQSIHAEGAGEANLDKLRFAVVDGQLRLWMERSIWDYVTLNDPPITVSITVPALTGIEASAASNVTATGLSGSSIHLDASSGSDMKIAGISGHDIHLSASSAGFIEVSGSCFIASVEVSSGADISGKGLECVDINVAASSAGHATLFASGQVNAEASSGARIELAGNPDHVDDDENSGGDVAVLR